MAEPDELVLTIARHLEVDWQYVELVEAWDVDRIAEIRSAGRRAGRLLGWKIATFQTDPARRDDGRVVVFVAVRESPGEEDDARMQERAVLLLNKVVGEQLDDD